MSAGDASHDALSPELKAALARPFKRIVVFNGAGMSADSGNPTFRSGSNGLWHEFDPEERPPPSAGTRTPYGASRGGTEVSAGGGDQPRTKRCTGKD